MEYPDLIRNDLEHVEALFVFKNETSVIQAFTELAIMTNADSDAENIEWDETLLFQTPPSCVCGRKSKSIVEHELIPRILEHLSCDVEQQSKKLVTALKVLAAIGAHEGLRLVQDGNHCCFLNLILI